MRKCLNSGGKYAKSVLYRESGAGNQLRDKWQSDESSSGKAFDVRGRERLCSKGLFRLLENCIAHKDLVVGRHVHDLIVRSGYESNTFLGHHVIRMYASHGSLLEANNVFSKLPTPNNFVWTSIISAHTDHGQAEQAIQLFKKMRNSSLTPDSYVYVAALKACAVAADFIAGKLVHADVIEKGLETNVYVGNSLVDMYTNCQSLDEARRVFDRLVAKDVVTWNTMIAGYVRCGDAEEAVQLYESMVLEGAVTPDIITVGSILKALAVFGHAEKAITLYRQLRESILKPNDYVLVALLQACARSGDLESGNLVHADVLESAFQLNPFVGSAVVDMYVKCGCLEKARRTFDSLSNRNEVTWSAMIAGYVQGGLGHEALDLFECMQQQGMTPDKVTLASILQACGSIGAIQEGRQIHIRCLELGLADDVVLGTVLIDMYARCGCLKEASLVFGSMSNRNVVTWTALINGFAQNSDCRMAMQCFENMVKDGVGPNSATFTALLVACSHVGWVTEGQRYFKAMSDHYGIMPTLEHHTCMVDLLGRTGRLDEAENAMLSEVVQDDAVGWLSLLSACKIHGDLGRGKRCFDHIVNLEPQQSAAYALMSSIYMDAGKWEDANSIERLRRRAGAQKMPAKATIEVMNKVREFVVGSKRVDLSTKLRSLNRSVKKEGHSTKTEIVFEQIPDEEKDDALCGHAEKLAMAFGLLSTPQGTTLLITKNLRMCRDCHTGTKVLSKIENREVIVRDAQRIHRFKNGLCSCGDMH